MRTQVLVPSCGAGTANVQALLEVPGDWVRALYVFICKAKDEGKCLRCRYDGTTFTPDALVAEILNGHFRWGVVNWEMIDPPARCDYEVTSAADAVRLNRSDNA